MMRMSVFFTAIIWLLAMGAAPGVAQLADGCVASEQNDPPRIVYQCANGLVLEAEAAATLGLGDAGGQQRPSSVEVDANGVLIEVEPGGGPFQILTPHAIAAVRGTVYVVDVTPDMTSVFVTHGVVAVSRRDGSEQVLLPAGFGVEVSSGSPVVAKRWPQEKVSRLMDRFGR